LLWDGPARGRRTVRRLQELSRLHGPALARHLHHRDEGAEPGRQCRARAGQTLLGESSDLEQHIQAARWVVICTFRRFEIWEPGKYPKQPVASLSLAELPDRYDVLAFLSGPNVEPSFAEHHRRLTTQAARQVALVYRSLIDRVAAPADEIQRFIMQAVWCLFAEDLGMLEGWPLQRHVSLLITEPERSSAAEIGFLFRVLNQKGHHNRTGLLAGTTYVNGQLFAQPAEVALNQDELRLLLEASKFDWRKVDPTIFGSLLEGVLGHDRRWELGMHYTHEVDILKIVTPTIARPWRQRIEATSEPLGARELLDELCAFRVLDPACGCGNFLYVAYRELRRLEAELKQRIRRLAHEQGLPLPPGPWPFYPLTNLLGIDIERTAVSIARVVLWMGHRQMIERYGGAESPLPLVDLSGIQVADALRVPWPDADCIIGNPPFLGSQHIRGAFGDDYVKWLQQSYGVGVKDFCVYWFRKAADHLKPGQRAGLVGTNSVAQNRARSASLAYVVQQGGVITDAVKSQTWPGEAKVHVSLVNWVDQPPEPPAEFILDGRQVAGIGSDLAESLVGAWQPQRLPANAGRCFQGLMPVGAGFVLSHEDASLLRDVEPSSEAELRPFLTGENISNRPDQSAGRWVVDFGDRGLEDAMNYPQALQLVRDRVKPTRERNRDRYRRVNWWRFGRPYAEVRIAMESVKRYVAMNQVGKRPCSPGSTPEYVRTARSTSSPSRTTTPWGFCCPARTAPGLGREGARSRRT
jgi:hypothetical protein